ncbi:hypothetical protein Vadar_025746 [Vaccinium darrowii]|uniref:Uncharacterized protein n=1 Tax=Vaccinium darrowii TaxID=229202 RepID=A0ACB7XK73_9ERIC|nr:hypothetical protein Vadar_025746 [Vaccinium darrowii]
MGKAFYNLRVRRKQQNYRLSPPPPPSSPDSPPSPPDSPPTPRRSRRRMHRDRRGKKLVVVFKTRHYLQNDVPAPTTESVSALFPVPEALQLPPPPPSPAEGCTEEVLEDIPIKEPNTDDPLSRPKAPPPIRRVLQPPPPPPPSPAEGYTEEVPVDIPSEEEEDQKPNIDDPLSRLKPPPPIVRRDASTMFVDELLEIIANVKSLLVSELVLSKSDINTMICSANRAFTALDCYGDDYISFYWTVRRFIHFNHELLVAATLRNGHCAVFGEISKRYEQLVLEANNAEETLQSAELNLARAKENVVNVTKRLGELRSLVIKLEEQLDHGETEVVSWQSEVNQCSLYHSSVGVEVRTVGLEEEKAKKVVDEVNKRCEEASSGIAMMKKQLWSLGTR